VKVAPLGKAELVKAITYQGTHAEGVQYPPTQFYMDLILQGAYSHGLSMMWIAYLQSFATKGPGKKAPPGMGLSRS
jgi:hypothetical protein